MIDPVKERLMVQPAAIQFRSGEQYAPQELLTYAVQQLLALRKEIENKCITEHLYQHTGRAGPEGQFMQCEKCGKGKWQPW